MQVTFGEKFKLIRNSLNLSQTKFAEMMDITISSYKKYEAGFQGIGAPALQKIANHPQCIKYALWLLTDTTNIEAGQVAPGDLSPDEYKKQEQLSQEEYEKTFKNQVEETMFMFCAMGWFKKDPDTKISEVGIIMLNKLQPIINGHLGTNIKANTQNTA